MFEGFPFLHGASLSYRAFFGGTFLAASLYQLALLAVFRAASRAAQARSARRGRDEAQRAYFECLGETAAARGGDAGGGGGGGEGRSKCARFLRRCRRWLWRSCAPRAAPHHALVFERPAHVEGRRPAARGEGERRHAD